MSPQGRGIRRGAVICLTASATSPERPTLIPGDSEAYEVNNPLWMPCTIAGSYVDSIEWYITNEVGKRIDNQNGHMEATIVLQWPAPSDEAAPPSSFSAKTDLSRVVQAWSGLKK